CSFRKSSHDGAVVDGSESQMFSSLLPFLLSLLSLLSLSLLVLVILLPLSSSPISSKIVLIWRFFLYSQSPVHQLPPPPVTSTDILSPTCVPLLSNVYSL